MVYFAKKYYRFFQAYFLGLKSEFLTLKAVSISPLLPYHILLTQAIPNVPCHATPNVHSPVTILVTPHPNDIAELPINVASTPQSVASFQLPLLNSLTFFLARGLQLPSL